MKRSFMRISAMLLAILQLVLCFAVTAFADETATAEAPKAVASAEGDSAPAPTAVTLAEHPRIYYTNDDIASMLDLIKRDEAGEITNENSTLVYHPTTLKNYILTEADTYLNEDHIHIEHDTDYVVDYPIPLQNPPETTSSTLYPWTALSRQVKNRIQTLTMAYVLTKDERYYERAKLITMSFVDNFVYWTDQKRKDAGKQTNLDTCEFTFGVCTFYDTFYDRLTEEERVRIETPLLEKGLKNFKYDLRATNDDNTYALRAAGIIMAACTIYDKIENPDEYIEAGKEFIRTYYEKRATSGDHEGAMYTSYAVDSFMPALDVLARSLGDKELLENEWVNKDLFEWIIGIGECKNGVPANISDSSYTPFFYSTASILAKWNGNALAAYYVTSRGTGGSGIDLISYMYDMKNIEIPENPGDDLQSKYFDKVGMTSMRTGWDTTDSLLVLTCGKSDAAHNHYDNNSFVIAMNGVWLASDPGYAYIGDDYALSLGHSTIFVDGKGQSAKGCSFTTPIINSPFFSYVIGSASNSYKTNGVTKFDRNTILVNHTFPYYVIMDELDGTSAHCYTWRLNTENAKSIEVNGEPINYSTIIKSNSANEITSGASLAIQFASNEELSMKYSKNGMSENSKYLDVFGSTEQKKEYLALLTPYAGSSVTYNMADNIDEEKNLDLTVLSNRDSTVSKTKADVSGMLLFKPESAGDSMTVPLDVAAEGEYTVTLGHVTGNLYGKTDVYIDDKKINDEPVVLYVDDYLDTAETVFENVSLEIGRHDLKFVSVENEANPDANYIGVISVKLDIADISTVYAKVDETLTDDSVIGCVAGYGSKGVQDIILFARDHEVDISKNGVETDADQITVMGVRDGKAETGIGAAGATTVTFGGQKLFESTVPADISINYCSSVSSTSEIKLGEDSTVSFYFPNYDQVDTDKVTVNSEKVVPQYNADTKTVTLSLKAGENTVDFGLAEEEEAGVNWTVIIIIICAAAVLAAVVALIIFLTKSKKKN